MLNCSSILFLDGKRQRCRSYVYGLEIILDNAESLCYGPVFGSSGGSCWVSRRFFKTSLKTFYVLKKIEWFSLFKIAGVREIVICSPASCLTQYK